ncbi:hypothetical protein CG716_08130 [Mycolicibacterium sphagni]|uniref:Uncharacterized protein n=1 Tax=Mycolicibacterium sphagni TaxID=1786 RepID=A0A255DMX9_9MYCO|nr:hypothetical protein CG716_08130 [Mycolicibacterium sphagni]
MATRRKPQCIVREGFVTADATGGLAADTPYFSANSAATISVAGLNNSNSVTLNATDGDHAIGQRHGHQHAGRHSLTKAGF